MTVAGDLRPLLTWSAKHSPKQTPGRALQKTTAYNVTDLQNKTRGVFCFPGWFPNNLQSSSHAL